MTPIAALFSALLPVSADLNKTGHGGSPHALSMLIGTLLIPILSGPPILILFLVHHRFHQPGPALVLEAFWMLLAVGTAAPLLRLAARAVAPRREDLALATQSR